MYFIIVSTATRDQCQDAVQRRYIAKQAFDRYAFRGGRRRWAILP